MVQEQIVGRGIDDLRVIHAMSNVKRHLFLDEALIAKAYHDAALPIGQGQTISQPFIVAKMSQLLCLSGSERVLEIGTGCGYQTAILSKLCRRVYSIERIETLYEKARKNIRKIQCINVMIRHGDGLKGWPEYAPFDRIIVTAGGGASPAWLSQLREGGMLIFPESNSQGHQLVQQTKCAEGYIEYRYDLCTFVPLLEGVTYY